VTGRMPIRSTPAPRKFATADLMILVAGFAAGIAWTQASLDDPNATLGEDLETATAIPWRLLLEPWIEAPTPIMASIGAALLVCRLRPPRPSLRRLARQPGAVALACMGLMLTTEGVLLLLGWALQTLLDWASPRRFLPNFFPVFPPKSWTLAHQYHEVGMAIASCWLALYLSGRWKPEPTWLDRLGRFLGIYWIVLHLLRSLATALQF